MSSVATAEAVKPWPYGDEDSPQMQQWARNVRDLERMLGLAKERLEKLSKPSETPADPAVVNVTGKARWEQLEGDVAKAANMISHQQAVELLESRLEAHRKMQPVPFTLEQLKAAKVVRTDVGWHVVNRVNRKSVSVKTQYSWCDRYPVQYVLEVR
jgi:hypothetical protein